MVAHVVVIGAGVYGVAVTTSLMRWSVRVTVVDAGAVRSCGPTMISVSRV
ncbi:MAG: hypothetical protein ACRDTG_09360 [Pseudonocardiaceae bacterium]